MKNITINTRFDGQTQHGSFTQHMWHRYKIWVLLRSVLCIAAVCLGCYIMEPGTKWGMFGGALVMVGSLGFIRPMLWQMWQERGLRKHPAFETEVSYTFSEAGVKMTGKAGNADIPWSALYELKATKKGLLIYQDKKQYLWIAKAAFRANEMQQVIGIWRQQA